VALKLADVVFAVNSILQKCRHPPLKGNKVQNGKSLAFLELGEGSRFLLLKKDCR